MITAASTGHKLVFRLCLSQARYMQRLVSGREFSIKRIRHQIDKRIRQIYGWMNRYNDSMNCIGLKGTWTDILPPP